MQLTGEQTICPECGRPAMRGQTSYTVSGGVIGPVWMILNHTVGMSTTYAFSKRAHRFKGTRYHEIVHRWTVEVEKQ